MIKVDSIGKTYARDNEHLTALDNMSFTALTGQLFTLLGPSGCGKSTMLRSIAGLEKPDNGTITIGSRRVFDAAARLNVPTNERAIGMVFQSYAIWPHMTVWENVAYPLRARGTDKTDMKRRVGDALELVGLGALGARPAPLLSGGQQQRVALARALVAEPSVLLLDEPLSNLDAKLRESLRHEIRVLQQRVGLTAVYVTHDQQEALAISDTIAVLNEGRIVEIGSPDELYRSPQHQFTASFLGSANFLEARILGDPAHHDEVTFVETSIGKVRCTRRGDQRRLGPKVTVFFRPENVELIPSGATSLPDDIPVRVISSVFLGNTRVCRLAAGDEQIVAHVHPLLSPAIGEQWSLRLDPAVVRLVTPHAPRVSVQHAAVTEQIRDESFGNLINLKEVSQ